MSIRVFFFHLFICSDVGQVSYFHHFLSCLSCTVSFISPVFCSLSFHLIFPLVSFYFWGLVVCDTLPWKVSLSRSVFDVHSNIALYEFLMSVIFCSVPSFCLFVCLFVWFVLLCFCILGKLETLSTFLFFFLTACIWCFIKTVLMPTKVSEPDFFSEHHHFVQISRSSGDLQCSSCSSNYF